MFICVGGWSFSDGVCGSSALSRDTLSSCYLLPLPHLDTHRGCQVGDYVQVYLW